MTDGRHGSKNVVLIMPLGWTASGGVGVCRSQRCKATWTYWMLCQWRRQRPLCCAGRTSVKSRETDRENGYENCLFLGTSDPLMITWTVAKQYYRLLYTALWLPHLVYKKLSLTNLIKLCEFCLIINYRQCSIMEYNYVPSHLAFFYLAIYPQFALKCCNQPMINGLKLID